MIREYGWVNRVSEVKGRNSRLDELQAAILNIKLKYLDADNQKRKDLASIYDALGSKNFCVPKRRDYSDHVFHLYVCRLRGRNELKSYLEENNIYPGIHYPSPIHLQPAYQDNIEIASSMEVTESICHDILSLPMYPELSLDHAKNITQLINKFLITHG